MAINANHQTNTLTAVGTSGTISGFTTNVGAGTYTQFLSSGTFTPAATTKVIYVE